MVFLDSQVQDLFEGTQWQIAASVDRNGYSCRSARNSDHLMT